MTQSRYGQARGRKVEHLIRRKKGLRFPTRFIFFDTETETIDNHGKQRLVLCHLIYWKVHKKTGRETVDEKTVYDSDSIYKYISDKLHRDRNIRIMSANIWFDLRVSGLLYHLRLTHWRCVKFFTSGHTFIACFEKNRLKMDFVNVQNYFNIPVSAIGKSIGLPKKEIDFQATSLPVLADYCKRDTEIIFKAIRLLYVYLRDNKLGSFQYTLPSIAFSCFTHSFIPTPITVHNQDNVTTLERNAYTGGRCECFRIGKFSGERFYKLDVNSMYPFVMIKEKYPVKYLKSGRGVDPKKIEKLFDRYSFIAECTVETDKPVYSHKLNGKLVFPVGRFKTYLASGSLQYAIKHNHIKSIEYLACYKSTYLFSEYVKFFYNLRRKYQKEGNAAFSFITKIILNSLYGKFGQRADRVIWEKPIDSDKAIRKRLWDVQEQQGYIELVFFHLHQMLMLKVDEGYNAFPAIAAHVTDFARLHLWHLIEKTKIANCYYIDTDSLIVNEPGFKNLSEDMNKLEIGKLKLEDTQTTLDIITAKCYTFGQEIKTKGIPKSAKRINKNTYRYPYFPSALSELGKGIKEDYRIETMEKVLTGKYEKGIVSRNGVVTPFHLPCRM